jgi:cyclic pyranopterin phosphate synthase
MSKLTHLDTQGQAHMVDVGGKTETHRLARAEGRIRMSAEALQAVEAGDSKKGDALGVARVAAIQAAKRTSDLIPLCHPLPITRISVDLKVDRALGAVVCTAQVETFGRTGVEMEALTAVQIGLLTVYDMCKSLDRSMRIEAVRLLEKRGGRSGHWMAPHEAQDEPQT